MSQRPLILASSSPARRAQLQQWRLDFTVVPSGIDETPLSGETPRALTERLALAKARHIARQFPAALVIGADQVADLDGAVLGKPGNAAAAREQLQRMRGRELCFYSALALVCEQSGFSASDVAQSVACYRRDLSEEEIARYVADDDPIDCAGASRIEARGSHLLESLRADDPSAIIGLPLIALGRLLRGAGFHMPPNPWRKA